jgi:diguanylate cyclase (GGDEF)-like protein
MARSPHPTPEVARARRYAARVRILLALVGGGLLAVDPALTSHPVPAAIGFAVIGVTGVFEWAVQTERWLAVEEALSCVAVVCMVGFSAGEVNLVSMLWLVAAASGVLARGGRVGVVGRAVVAGTLLSPIVTQGVMSPEAIGFAAASIALLLATGRISRETAELLHRARHDAAHDSLTGLLSRASFRSQVDRLTAVATAERPATLIAIDLDDFGAINKRLGHAAGDRLLVQAARAMEETLREGDVLGRLGGDEFAALVFCEDPVPVAKRLLDAVASNGVRGSSGCAGIASSPRDGIGAEALLAAADVALRISKRAGRHAVRVYQGAPIAAGGADGARAALERLSHGYGLRMTTQPIVDLESGRIHAYEALARFATRGGEGPLHWFALADEFGLRAELELACLDASLALLPKLPDGSRLSANLSAPLLVDPRTSDLLDASGDVSRLIIEVTEETLVRHGEAVDRTLASLRRRGVLFAVDDVGAGYSGLSQLATLRPTYLKLDRGLVSEIAREPARVELVRALSDYARGTGGMLVAEGVETAEQLAHVRAAGAPLAQGYLLARPGDPWPQLDDDARALVGEQLPRIHDPRGVEPLLRGADEVEPDLAHLGGHPGRVVAPDGVVVGDGAARGNDRLARG